MTAALLRRCGTFAGRLRRDSSGLALLEFAFTLPLVLAVGGYGSELSYLALTNMKVSQYALNLADNASRVGLLAGNGVTQLREADINDVLTGAKLEGQVIGLTTYGRVTLSSLENLKQSYDSAYTQRIHWQRCIGAMSGTDAATGRSYDSNFGTALKTAGSTAPANYTAVDNDPYAGLKSTGGMGNPAVSASQGSAVMFVEVTYKYQPLFGSLFVTPPQIRYVASFVVRDNRDFTHLYNPSPTATASTCDLHSA